MNRRLVATMLLFALKSRKITVKRRKTTIIAVKLEKIKQK